MGMDGYDHTSGLEALADAEADGRAPSSVSEYDFSSDEPIPPVGPQHSQFIKDPLKTWELDNGGRIEAGRVWQEDPESQTGFSEERTWRKPDRWGVFFTKEW